MYKNYKVIALCISHISDTRHYEFINELYNHVKGTDYRLFIYQTCSDMYWNTKTSNGEQQIFDLMDYSIIDTVVIWDEAFYDKRVPQAICDKAHENGVPVICIGASREGCCNINFEYVSGFEKIVRHIVEEHGITDVFVLAGPKGNSYSDDRIEVCRKVLSEHGTVLTEDMIGYGDFWDVPTERVISGLISGNRLPRAIVSINDVMAITACNVLQRNGYKIPGDVIVTGFDGLDEALCCTPSITTCGCDLGAVSACIIEHASKAAAGEDICGEIEVPYIPMIEGSCGCNNENKIMNTGQLLKSHNDIFRLYRENEHLMYEMSSEAITCKNRHEFVEYLKNFNFEDTCIVVNTECFDDSLEPGKALSRGFGEDMYEIYADGTNVKELPLLIKRSDMFADFDSIMQKDRPVVFVALTYMGMPIGYTGFFFEVNTKNYCMVMQFVTLINTTLSGYRNMRYLQYTARAMENMYKYDHLTGLYNRHAFYNELQKMLAEQIAEDVEYMVATIDLDGLKHINDTYGHQEGDFAISAVAQAVKSIPVRDKILGRFGGDEMVVCLRVTDAGEKTGQLRADIRSYLDYVNRTSDKPYKISVSLGVVTHSVAGFDFDSQLKMSDSLMYTEKMNKKAVVR